MSAQHDAPTTADRAVRLLGLTVAWTAAYLAVRGLLRRARTAVFCNSLVSLVHAVIILAVAAPAIQWKHPLSHFGQPATPEEMTVLSVSLAYFVYDTVCCLLIDGNAANFLHHLCSLLGLGVGVFQAKSGTELTVCLFLMEVSNPFLHGRTLLKELGQGASAIAVLNDVLFAATFALCRVLIGPFVTYYTLVSPTSSPIVKVGGAGIQVVSTFWFLKIVQVVQHKARKAARMARASRS